MIKVQSREDFLREVAKELTAEPIAVEIGVLNGDFSEKILSYLNPQTLILIDPYEVGGESYKSGECSVYSTEADYKKLIAKFDNEISQGRIIVRRNYSYDVVEYYRNGQFDFIYIDASHLYSDAKRDLKDWLPKLKVGGLIGGHDYIYHDNFGVIPAVDEFCKEHNFEMIIFNENGGDFALKRI